MNASGDILRSGSCYELQNYDVRSETAAESPDYGKSVEAVIQTHDLQGFSGPEKNPKFDYLYHQLSEGIVELMNMKLKEIPNFIFEYRQPIKIVYLQDNKLHELPPGFFDDLPYMAWCDLRFNELEKLPAMTKPHSALRVLMLQKNQLTNLPYSLGEYGMKIRTLGLNGNPLHDPPKQVIEAGVATIKMYLMQCLKSEAIAKDGPDYTSKCPRPKWKAKSTKKLHKTDCTEISDEDDYTDVPNFTKALYESVARKRKPKLKAYHKAIQSQNPFQGMNPKTATKIKYTNDLWRDVPFEGILHKHLLEKSLEEMRKHVFRKFAAQRDKLLQRIKDREVLLKWRFETKQLQKAGRRPGSCCLVAPPYGVSSDVVQEDDATVTQDLKFRKLNPEEFQQEVSACSRRLQEFIDNPTPISDSSAALLRLQEVEEIQRRLCSLKLRSKNPVPSQ